MVYAVSKHLIVVVYQVVLHPLNHARPSWKKFEVAILPFSGNLRLPLAAKEHKTKEICSSAGNYRH
ncbi:hypothetical protein DASC09_039380 [Saccharomycopsis crataegensis]|uniref:Uncharacterized protein n=1 Tax=Saccharomycopsis crataegensis TaxID=43959 RepID=A0AAV5QR34_9ASCO|nr:hypothetical protein DASC09_039380 [Saccharomycopsis crataegensis]